MTWCPESEGSAPKAANFCSGHSCTGGGKLSATLDGDTLSGSLTAGSVHASLDGTVVSDQQIDGTYTLAQAGACPDDSGSFHRSR